MKNQEGFFQGIRETKIYYQCWLPDSEPQAILLLVHGIGEHCGRYMNVVNYLVPRGYAVYGLDHIGHGRSEGSRVFVKAFEDFTITLKKYWAMVRQQQPDKPIFLFGHSMGGLIGSYHLLDYQSDFAGAILSGPAIKVNDEAVSPTLRFIVRSCSRLLPSLRLAQLESEGISRDPAVVQAYEDDPLVYNGKVTARLGGEMLRAIDRVTAEASQITLPILILQGEEDKIVDPIAARMLHDGVSCQDRTLKTYPGLYHEIFNEPEHQEVLADVASWLDARSA